MDPGRQCLVMTRPNGPGRHILRKGRYSQEHGTYLITVITDERVPWFQQFDLGCTMCRCMEMSDQNSDSRMLCWVVMPDHFHALVRIGKEDLSSVVRRLKAGSASRLNRQIGRKGRFWMPGFHNHGLRSEESLKDIARYIVGNPLRAGMVTKYGDYPFWDAVWL